MLIPSYCPEDNNGPVSREEALRLVRLMEQRELKVLAKNQICGPVQNLSDFDYANGSTNALSWCYDLIERITPDPESNRNSLLESAAFLERQAQELRRRAKSPG